MGKLRMTGEMSTLKTAKQLLNENNKIPFLIIGTFALLSAVSIFNTFSRFHLPPSTTTPPALQTPVIASHNPEIATFHLFGQYQDNLNLLPETTLQLTLEGVAMAVDKKDTSRAIISSGGSSKIYSVGQTVPGGATIKAINQTQVVLDQNHQLTSLKLPIPKLKMENGVYQSTTPN